MSGGTRKKSPYHLVLADLVSTAEVNNFFQLGRIDMAADIAARADIPRDARQNVIGELEKLKGVLVESPLSPKAKQPILDKVAKAIGNIAAQTKADGNGAAATSEQVVAGQKTAEQPTHNVRDSG